MPTPTLQHTALFLRAVNVGGTGKLPMARLRALLEQAGAETPETYIASGNAVLSHTQPLPDLRAKIEDLLTTEMGAAPGIFLRSLPELDALIAANPFPDAAPARLHVLLSDDPIPADPATLAKGRTTEQLAPGPGAIFINYTDGAGRSRLRLPQMQSGTARNLNTINRLRKMLAARMQD